MATPASANIPRWLSLVLICDRVGSSWYIGAGFFFAPVLAILSPWPALTTVLWVAIGVFGLWLGLLGIAMATGLAMALRSNAEIPEDYWRSILDYPSAPAAPGRRASSNVTASAIAAGAWRPTTSRSAGSTMSKFADR